MDDSKIPQILATNITTLRYLRGVTQEQLAKKAMIPRSTLTHFESGSGNPSLKNLIRVADALEVGVDELLSPSISSVCLLSNDEINFKEKNGVKIYNLLTTPIKGLSLERFEFQGNDGFTGSPHLKGSKEYFTVVSGKAQVQVSGEEFSVKQGEVLIFTGDSAHSYRNLSERKTIALSILITET